MLSKTAFTMLSISGFFVGLILLSNISFISDFFVAFGIEKYAIILTFILPSNVLNLGYFNKKYVATGIFSREAGKRLGRLKMVREESDYSDFYIASKEDAEKQYETAELIITEAKKYLKQFDIV